MRGRRRGSLMIGASILLTPEEGQRIAQERNPIEARQIAYAHARLRCAFIAADRLCYYCIGGLGGGGGTWGGGGCAGSCAAEMTSRVLGRSK